MDLGKVITALGIEGIDPSKLSLVIKALQEAGADVEVDEQDLRAYYPDISEEGIRDFYLPKVGPDFYIPRHLRKLTTPNLSHLRRLL